MSHFSEAHLLMQSETAPALLQLTSFAAQLPLQLTAAGSPAWLHAAHVVQKF
jgi:hypothetical protein